MKTRNILMMIAVLACTTTASYGALSAGKTAWAKGPVQFLMTKEEVAAWNKLQTDAQADEFIALFWARRDPTPATPRNEFHEDFDLRVAAADTNFSTKSVVGSLSDRGKILILFGAPTRAVRSGGGGSVSKPSTPAGTFASRTTDTEAADTADMAKLLWTYEGENAPRMFGAPRVEFRFMDKFNDRNMRLETPTIDLPGAEQRVIMAAITQPNLTQAPTIQTTTAPMAQVPASTTAFKTPALETAFADAKAGKIPSKGSSLTYAEFMSPAGDYYVPIGLYVPASAGLAADAADTFFGVIEDSTGKRVEVFEQPAKGTLSKSNYFYDYTATLPSGTYTATLGLAKAGVPVVVTSGALTTSAIAKTASGTSKLVLSDIIETIEAAPVKSPFAFGKLKIVPRAAFTNKDELGYFVEVHNPGVDPTTNLPKIQAKIDLIRPSGPPISAPLSDVAALPLSGAPGPGEYAVISGIPLDALTTPLKPGDYTLRVKLVDTVTKQSYTVEQKFKIVG